MVTIGGEGNTNASSFIVVNVKEWSTMGRKNSTKVTSINVDVEQGKTLEVIARSVL